MVRITTKGADLLDVRFRIEKVFEISFTAEDFAGIVRDGDITVGDLYDSILAKLHLQDVGRYDVRLNFAFWQELQGVISFATNFPVEAVELKTPLVALCPRNTRREKWAALRAACPYRVRDLGYPLLVRLSGFTLAVLAVFCEGFQVWQLPGVKGFWPVLGLFGLWMVAETYLKVLAMLGRFRISFPSRMRTVKDLCRNVFAANYADVCHEHSVEIPLDERCHKVWHQLTEILFESTGVDPEKVTFRSRLVRDLGVT